MENSLVGHFFGSRKCLGEELISPVVEWLNKGLMAVSSPNAVMRTWSRGERISTAAEVAAPDCSAPT
eukprot:5774189-Pyramimonas_sp.AAC.1